MLNASPNRAPGLAIAALFLAGSVAFSAPVAPAAAPAPAAARP